MYKRYGRPFQQNFLDWHRKKNNICRNKKTSHIRIEFQWLTLLVIQGDVQQQETQDQRFPRHPEDNGITVNAKNYEIEIKYSCQNQCADAAIGGIQKLKEDNITQKLVNKFPSS